MVTVHNEVRLGIFMNEEKIISECGGKNDFLDTCDQF